MGFFYAWMTVSAVIIGAIVGRAYERNRWQQRLLERQDRRVDGPKRLTESARIERVVASPDAQQFGQALDAIALEVERIGEGQRFLTKLLAERDGRPAAKKGLSPLPGSLRSPIPPAS